MTDATGAAELRPLQVEMNGINVISESERKGHPRDLFWPWFAANISVLGLSYGAFVLDFGISFARRWSSAWSESCCRSWPAGSSPWPASGARPRRWC